MSHIPSNWHGIVLQNTRDEGGGAASKTSKRKSGGGGGTIAVKKTKTEPVEESEKACAMTVQNACVNKQCVHQNVNDTQADSMYRNEICQNISVVKDEGGARQDCIKSLVGKVSASLNKVINMTNFKDVMRGVEAPHITYTNTLQSVSKAYEDTYLRQAVGIEERSCVRGEDCECMFIDATQPFVGVEYLLPWERSRKEVNGMCLPCTRAATQALFYDILHSDTQVTGLVQKFYNEHSREGEYRLCAMLFCPPSGPLHNLPMPVLRHQRNFYSVHCKNNVYFMNQVGVDFR